MKADTRSPFASRSAEVQALVTEASGLLAQATKLHGNADESWRVAHIVKRKPYPFVWPDDFDDIGEGE